MFGKPFKVRKDFLQKAEHIANPQNGAQHSFVDADMEAHQAALQDITSNTKQKQTANPQKGVHVLGDARSHAYELVHVMLRAMLGRRPGNILWSADVG